MSTISALVLLLILNATNLVAQSAYNGIDVVGGGTIVGKVSTKGTLNTGQKLRISKDHATCGSVKVSPRLEVGKSGGVRDAVVYLEAIAEGKKFPATEKILLNQHKCEYEPHIVILPVGSPLEIVNSDPILHNVHAYAGTQSTFNIAQPIKGQRSNIKQTQLAKPGIISLTCDAGHPWMSGYLFVVPHPYYAVTDKNGSFRIENIPPGTYTLKVWHEGVAIVDKQIEKEKVIKYLYEEPYEASKEVRITSNDNVAVDFELSLRPAPAVDK